MPIRLIKGIRDIAVQIAISPTVTLPESSLVANIRRINEINPDIAQNTPKVILFPYKSVLNPFRNEFQILGYKFIKASVQTERCTIIPITTIHPA
jgi:hypothetical protein